MEPICHADLDLMLSKYLGENLQDSPCTEYCIQQPGEDTTWSHLCLLLDYDGTLAPHGSHPDLTILPRETKEVATTSSPVSTV